MDIAALSIYKSFMDVRMNASYKVASIAMDVADNNSSAIIEMAESANMNLDSVTKHLGNTIDIKL